MAIKEREAKMKFTDKMLDELEQPKCPICKVKIRNVDGICYECAEDQASTDKN